MELTDENEFYPPGPILSNNFLIKTYITLFQSSQEYFNEFTSNDSKINYSLLLFIILGVTKVYHSQITFQDLSPAHYRILINKDAPKNIVALFQKLYEELTLEKTQISENNSNEWVFNFNF